MLSSFVFVFKGLQRLPAVAASAGVCNSGVQNFARAVNATAPFLDTRNSQGRYRCGLAMERFNPKRVVAPRGPETTHLVSLTVVSICFRSTSSRVSLRSQPTPPPEGLRTLRRPLLPGRAPVQDARNQARSPQMASTPRAMPIESFFTDSPHS